MKIGHLVFCEIRHRWLNFIGVVLAVFLTSGILVGTGIALSAHMSSSDRLLDQRRRALQQDTDDWNNEIRKIMKRTGFNVRILPKGTDLTSLYNKGYADKYMPENYAEKLANSKLATINHLLPSLRSRVKWTEQADRLIQLIGIRGEVPLSHKKKKKEMETGQPVPSGKIVLGYLLHEMIGKDIGGEVTFLGKKFILHKFFEEKGNLHDNTAWIPLADAQELLGLDGVINEIEALDCTCATNDLQRIAAIRGEIEKILPGTIVVEHKNKALARAEARQKSAQKGKANLIAEEGNQKKLKMVWVLLSIAVVPMVVFVAAIWIILLGLSNVHQRRSEIALFRAIGTPSSKILKLFLARAGLSGLVGAIFGVALSLVIAKFAGVWDDLSLLVIILAATTLIGTPLLAILSASLPAARAARTDPADILRGI